MHHIITSVHESQLVDQRVVEKCICSFSFLGRNQPFIVHSPYTKKIPLELFVSTLQLGQNPSRPSRIRQLLGSSVTRRFRCCLSSYFYVGNDVDVCLILCTRWHNVYYTTTAKTVLNFFSNNISTWPIATGHTSTKIRSSRILNVCFLCYGAESSHVIFIHIMHLCIRIKCDD